MTDKCLKKNKYSKYDISCVVTLTIDWKVGTMFGCACLIRIKDVTQWDSVTSNVLKSLKDKTPIYTSKRANTGTDPGFFAFVLKIKLVLKLGFMEINLVNYLIRHHLFN